MKLILSLVLFLTIPNSIIYAGPTVIPVDPFDPERSPVTFGEDRERELRPGTERQEAVTEVVSEREQPANPESSEELVELEVTQITPIPNPEPFIIEYESFTFFPGLGQITDLCQLVQGLWNIGFITLFISAFAAIVYGALLYTAAGVNAGKVNQAKEIFANAIIGLIIGLSVVIVIQVINPDLLVNSCEIPDIESVGDGSFEPVIGGAIGGAIGGVADAVCSFLTPCRGTRWLLRRLLPADPAAPAPPSGSASTPEEIREDSGIIPGT